MAEPAEHISCQEVVELVSDYLDGDLAADRTSLFEQHLNFCEGCVWYVDELRTTVSRLGEIREEHVPPDTREQLLKAFRDWRTS